MLLQVLLVMVIVDYATGLMAAGTQGGLKARSAKGIARKGIYLFYRGRCASDRSRPAISF
nr:phage holin family protein [Paenibacillus larvae]